MYKNKVLLLLCCLTLIIFLGSKYYYARCNRHGFDIKEAKIIVYQDLIDKFLSPLFTATDESSLGTIFIDCTNQEEFNFLKDRLQTGRLFLKKNSIKRETDRIIDHETQKDAAIFSIDSIREDNCNLCVYIVTACGSRGAILHEYTFSSKHGIFTLVNVLHDAWIY